MASPLIRILSFPAFIRLVFLRLSRRSPSLTTKWVTEGDRRSWRFAIVVRLIGSVSFFVGSEASRWSTEMIKSIHELNEFHKNEKCSWFSKMNEGFLHDVTIFYICAELAQICGFGTGTNPLNQIHDLRRDLRRKNAICAENFCATLRKMRDF